LRQNGLPRFSWYVLSAPQADVKSALMKLTAIRLNGQTTLVKSLVMVRSFRVLPVAVNRAIRAFPVATGFKESAILSQRTNRKADK
jgi:hypothetical protein